jgi:MMPL family
VLGQIGTIIGLGLLFDTLIVRSFMTPSIAALLGRWFWWPQRVRPRPASQMLRPYGPIVDATPCDRLTDGRGFPPCFRLWTGRRRCGGDAVT